jgi:hypothetical protein
MGMDIYGMIRIKRFDDMTIGSIKESVADERRGQGLAVDLSDGHHGIVFMNNLPEELINIHDTAVNYWDETINFMSYKKVMVPKDKTLYTTQRWVSGTFLDNLASDPSVYPTSDIILAEDSTGRLWVMDGHHRVVHDRRAGRDFMAFVVPFSDVAEIDRTFYGEGSDL